MLKVKKKVDIICYKLMLLVSLDQWNIKKLKKNDENW